MLGASHRRDLAQHGLGNLSERCFELHPRRRAVAPLRERHGLFKAGLQDIIRAEAKRHGWRISIEAALAVLDLDLELNAQGLAIWFDSLSAAR